MIIESNKTVMCSMTEWRRYEYSIPPLTSRLACRILCDDSIIYEVDRHLSIFRPTHFITNTDTQQFDSSISIEMSVRAILE